MASSSGPDPVVLKARHPLGIGQSAAKRRAESIIGQSEGAPGILSGWDIEVTDHRGRTVLIVPINGPLSLQQVRAGRHLACRGDAMFEVVLRQGGEKRIVLLHGLLCSRT